MNIKTKIAGAIATAALLAATMMPVAASAATTSVTIKGNGVGSLNGAFVVNSNKNVVKQSSTTVANTFVLTGLVASSQVFNKGDKIQFAPAAGVFMVNPLNYQPLAQTAQFVVANDVISDGSGNATVTVNPTIVISGARQNISGAIPNGAQLLLANSHNESIAFHNQAIVFAAPPITELKGGVEAATTYSDLYKMAMCYTLGADIRNYVQLDRMDVICGVAINPEFAVTVMS